MGEWFGLPWWAHHDRITEVLLLAAPLLHPGDKRARAAEFRTAEAFSALTALGRICEGHPREIPDCSWHDRHTHLTSLARLACPDNHALRQYCLFMRIQRHTEILEHMVDEFCSYDHHKHKKNCKDE